MLQHVKLRDNNFTLNQVLDIEDQLLRHLNKLSYLEIRSQSSNSEKIIQCPICSDGKEKNCSCSDCTNIGKFNKLLDIAEKTDVYCYNGSEEKNPTETAIYFRDAEKDCETCRTLNKHYGLIAFSGR